MYHKLIFYSPSIPYHMIHKILPVICGPFSIFIYRNISANNLTTNFHSVTAWLIWKRQPLVY